MAHRHIQLLSTQLHTINSGRNSDYVPRLRECLLWKKQHFPEFGVYTNRKTLSPTYLNETVIVYVPIFYSFNLYYYTCTVFKETFEHFRIVSDTIVTILASGGIVAKSVFELGTSSARDGTSGSVIPLAPVPVN